MAPNLLLFTVSEMKLRQIFGHFVDFEFLSDRPPVDIIGIAVASHCLRTIP
jgi:hypothetical protein